MYVYIYLLSWQFVVESNIDGLKGGRGRRSFRLRAPRLLFFFYFVVSIERLLKGREGRAIPERNILFSLWKEGGRDHGLFFLQGSFNELRCSGGVFFRDGWSLIGIIDGQIRLPLDYFDLWLNEISREIVRIERGGIYIINCWRLQKRYFAFKIWNNFNNPPPFLPF